MRGQLVLPDRWGLLVRKAIEAQQARSDRLERQVQRARKALSAQRGQRDRKA